MENPETGFKSNMLGEQPEDVSEEVRELFKTADQKYADKYEKIWTDQLKLLKL